MQRKVKLLSRKGGCLKAPLINLSSLAQRALLVLFPWRNDRWLRVVLYTRNSYYWIQLLCRKNLLIPRRLVKSWTKPHRTLHVWPAPFSSRIRVLKRANMPARVCRLLYVCHTGRNRSVTSCVSVVRTVSKFNVRNTPVRNSKGE